MRGRGVRLGGAARDVTGRALAGQSMSGRALTPGQAKGVTSVRAPPRETSQSAVRLRVNVSELPSSLYDTCSPAGYFLIHLLLRNWCKMKAVVCTTDTSEEWCL